MSSFMDRICSCIYNGGMKAFQEIRHYPTELSVWHSIHKNIGISAHWHNEIEIISLRAGSCVMHINSETIPAKAGDLLVCDSGDIHYCRDHSEDLVFEFLVFDPELLKFHMKNQAFASHKLDGTLVKGTELEEEWTGVLARIDREISGQKKYHKEYLRASLTAFWCCFLRYCTFAEDTPEVDQHRIVQQFRKVLSYMEQNYREEITLAQVADLAGFSVSYTSRFFRRLTGTGFLEYLNLLRVSNAADMLHNTDLRIIDIAYECGFNNNRSFNRTFLRYAGVTPSEYRERGSEDHSFGETLRSFREFTTEGDRNPTLIRAEETIE